MKESQPEAGSLEEAALAIGERDDEGLSEGGLSVWSGGRTFREPEWHCRKDVICVARSLGPNLSIGSVGPQQGRVNPVCPSGKAQLPKC